jgi:GNAT superfamily N-acetyltransferase
VEELDTASAADLAAAMGEEGDLVALRLARGCRCFALRLDGEIASYGWLSSGPEWIGEVGLEIGPGAGEDYVWNCVTLPGLRLRGFFRALLLFVVEQARTEGRSRLWIASLADGPVSAIAGAGFAPVLAIGVVDRPGRRELTARAASAADPELLKSARRALRLGDRPLPASLTVRPVPKVRH